MLLRDLLNVLIWLLLVLGYYEAIIGFLQWMNLIMSHNLSSPLTGTFYNSGPYACLLSVLFPIASYLMANKKQRVLRWVGSVMVILCSILIPASLSRTAMAACAIGCIISLKNKLLIDIIKTKGISIIISSVVLIIIITYLYSTKLDSAEGRFLMWKVASKALMDASITGLGFDNVAGVYGEAQEKYFESGRGTEQEIMIADAPEYVFNEYLQVAIAFGLFASLGMIALMVGGFIASYKSQEYGIAGSIAAIAVVMMASYPLQFPLFTITIALILVAAYLSASSNALKICGTAITITACTLFLLNSNKTDIKSEFSTAHILHRQGNYQKSNEILLDLTAKSSDPMILNIIGKNYQSLGMRDSAEYYFRKSTFRCPNRMYPHYLLMKLYADSIYFDKTKCFNEANTILTMRVKIPSPATDEMQREAKLMINNMKK